MRKMRTVLALMLALSLCLTMFPASIFAQTDDPITEPVPAVETLVTEPEVEEAEDDLTDAVESTEEVFEKAPALEKSTVEVESLVKDAPAEESKNAMSLEEAVKAEGSKTDEKEADVFPGTDTSVVINPNNPLTLDADTGNNDENDDNGDDSTVDYSLTIVWKDADNINGLRPNIEKIKDELDLHQAIGTGGKDRSWGPPDDFEKDGNKYVFTWHKLPKEVNGNTCRYDVKSMPDIPGYLHESNEAGDLYTYTLDAIDFVVTIRWEDNNDEYGNRPSAADCAEKMGLNLVSEDAEATEILGLSDRKPVVTDNGDDSYTVTWEDLPEFLTGETVVYIAQENSSVAGYIGTYENTGESKLYGAYEGGTIVNTTHMIQFSAIKLWEDGRDKDGDRPTSITLYLNADGEKIDTLTISPDENGKWAGSFEDDYPKYKNGKEIEYTLSEEPIEGYVASIEKFALPDDFDEGEYFKAKASDSVTVTAVKEAKSVSERAAKEVETAVKEKEKVDDLIPSTQEKVKDPVTKYEYEVTNTKVVDVIVTKQWWDDHDRDKLRPSPETFADAVGLELRAYLKYTSISVDLGDNQNPVVKEIDDGFVDAYEISWTGLPKYLKDKSGNYLEARYYVKENLTALKEIEYKSWSTIMPPHDPNGEAVRMIDGAAWNGGKLSNEHTPEKISIKINKWWDVGDDTQIPDSITIRLLANGEDVWEEPKTITAEDRWTTTYEGLYKYEDGQLIDYRVVEEQVEGFSKPDYEYIPEKPTDEINNIQVNISNSEPTTISITKRWEDNNNEDGNRPTPDQLIESKAFMLRRTIDGKNYDYSLDGFDPEIVNNENNTYTITWENLPKSKDGHDWLYSVSERDFIAHEDQKYGVNIGTGYFLTFSTLGDPGQVDFESDSWPMDNGKQVWIFNGGSFTNTYRRELVELHIQKLWDDNDNAHGKRPKFITVLLTDDSSEEPVRTVEIRPDEKGNWEVVLTDLQRYRGGEDIKYDIEEPAVEGYHTTYKNSLIPDPVDPSNSGNPTVDPGEWGEVVVPVTPGEDQVQQVAQAQQEYQDTRKVVKMAAKAVAESKSGVVIDEIPQQNTFVVESIIITNKEYCTARWVDEDGKLITPTEDGKYEPVEFDYDATGEDVPAKDKYGDGPEKEGYTFAGWETIENVDEDGNKTGDITYQATYTQDAIVRYHSNYPEALELTDLQKDEYYSEKRDYTIADLERVGFDDLTEKGYQFLGWTTSEDGTVIEYKPGDSYPAAAPANGKVASSSAASSVLRALRSAASSSEATGEENIVLKLYAQWDPLPTPPETDPGEDVPNTAKWVDENDEPIPDFEPIQFGSGENPPADDYYGDPPAKDGYRFTGWDAIEETDEEGNKTGDITYKATYEPVTSNPPSGGSNRPTTQTEDPVTEEPTEIDDDDTPLAPGTVEEEDTNIDDGDVPLAGVEEEEEIAEEATPLTPFTGDGRHTAVWGIVSILSLLGIVLLTYKRRREE